MGTLVCTGVTIQRVLPTLYRGLELQIAKTPRNNRLMVSFVDEATFCTDPEDLERNAQSYMAY